MEEGQLVTLMTPKGAGGRRVWKGRAKGSCCIDIGLINLVGFTIPSASVSGKYS